MPFGFVQECSRSVGSTLFPKYGWQKVAFVSLPTPIPCKLFHFKNGDCIFTEFTE